MANINHYAIYKIYEKGENFSLRTISFPTEEICSNVKINPKEFFYDYFAKYPSEPVYFFTKLRIRLTMKDLKRLVKRSPPH